jgi:hypothetical protein
MIEHARVVLLRPSPAGYEILLVRRETSANLPGGRVDDGEDVRVAAARSVFEDCGVLLARDSGAAVETLELMSFGALRKRVRDRGENATELLRSNGLTWSSDTLLPWAHWLTPSVDTQRTSTRLFVTELPAGMRTAFDATESALETWISPADAEALARDLAFSPMLVRTCWELARHASIPAVLDAARKRASEMQPILPRLASAGSRFLLLPWDPEYEQGGQGESQPFSYTPSWAVGPSRFVLEDRTWKHVDAPGSTSAG